MDIQLGAAVRRCVAKGDPVSADNNSRWPLWNVDGSGQALICRTGVQAMGLPSAETWKEDSVIESSRQPEKPARRLR
jgi:hypothetical protein